MEDFKKDKICEKNQNQNSQFKIVVKENIVGEEKILDKDTNIIKNDASCSNQTSENNENNLNDYIEELEKPKELDLESSQALLNLQGKQNFPHNSDEKKQKLFSFNQLEVKLKKKIINFRMPKEFH